MTRIVQCRSRIGSLRDGGRYRGGRPRGSQERCSVNGFVVAFSKIAWVQHVVMLVVGEVFCVCHLRWLGWLLLVRWLGWLDVLVVVLLLVRERRQLLLLLLI